jgi:putative oxygen-independent coproporphyrinogen III oxidase
MKNSGLYVHIPFCLKKCAYCDFYSIPYDEAAAEKYVVALSEEYDKISERYRPRFDTIYIGGGTPNALSTSLFEKLAKKITENFAGGEFTVELNPAASTDFNFYKSLGINRISLGVQSLNDKTLKAAGRLHTAKEALSSLEKAAGVFENVGADVILGLPFNTEEDIKNTLSGVLPFVKHISAYILKLSDNVPMYKIIDSLPDSDAAASLYETAYDFLLASGFERYEISNFCRENHYSRHNMKYWTGGDYIGLGAAAHSFINGIRYENPPDLQKYISGENLGNSRASAAKVSRRDALFEDVMLGLRLDRGLDVPALDAKYNIDFLLLYKREISRSQILEYRDGRLFLPADKILLENQVLMNFM